MLQVASHDEVALGVRRQPALAAAQQLLDLGLADEVVLVVVEDRHQHVDVLQQVLEAERRPQLEVEVRALPPVGKVLVQGAPGGGDLVAERLEEPPEQLLAAAAGQSGDARGERQRRLGQRLAVPAAAVESAAEGLGDGDAEERRGDVGPIVDVLVEEGSAPRTPVAHQADRVDVEEQCRGAALALRLGVEDVRLAEGKLEALRAIGVLVQQVAEIGGGSLMASDGQEHVVPSVAGRSRERSIESLRPCHAFWSLGL
jgi:hypothetical protein